ncbi:MAG: glycosyltransferase [Candidatus Bathyarchaeia archaeon]
MKFSVVIPTKNRSTSLRRLLLSILKQTTVPDEVIVVDDSDGLETKNLVEQLYARFLEKGIKLKHIMPDGNLKSISKARNLGAKEAEGNILLFLDDDVTIDKNYLEEILKVFKAKPNALGVQGIVANAQYSHFWNSIKKVFFYWHAEKDKCRMLPSGKTTFAYASNRVILCEWLLGLGVAYKKEVFKEFSFNEKLLGYSLGEDKEFSYKIYKKYPRSLFLTPLARAYHHRLPLKNTGKQKIYIITAYPSGFFLNNIEQTLKNKIIFLWSEIGRIILSIFWSLPEATKIKHIITSYFEAIRHLNDIKNENYSFIFRI